MSKEEDSKIIIKKEDLPKIRIELPPPSRAHKKRGYSRKVKHKSKDVTHE